MPYEPLHHKYRPQTFAALVGQDTIASTLTSAIRQQRVAPAYLFTGPRGTGKTSSARILAKSLNCLASQIPTDTPCGGCEVCQAIARGTALDVIEIDAASNTGVDNIRELIERAQFAPVQCRYKVYVIDECHMLSVAAFNALLKTLEEPPARVVFVLATTDPQRVLPTIISRCQRFDFRRIPLEAMVAHLRAIAAQEGIDIYPDAVQLVAQIAQGGLRDAESLLDQLSLLPPPITMEQVWDLVGAVPEGDLMQLVQAIAANNPEAILDQTRHLMNRGREPLIVLQNLAGFYRDLLIGKTAPQRQDLVMITPTVWNQVCELAQELDISTILAGQQHLRACEIQIKNTAQPRLWLEVTLLGLLPPVGSSLASQIKGTNSSPGVKPQWQPAAAQAAPPPLLEKHPGTVISDLSSHEEQVTPGSAQSTIDIGNAAPGLPKPLPQPIVAIGLASADAESATAVQLAGKLREISSQAQLSANSSTVNQPMEDRLEQPKPDSSRLASLTDRANPALAQKTGNSALPSTDNAVQPDLDEIWQKVILHLHPPGTQALLRQQGRLLSFNGQKAQISISSQPLFKMAQARLPNVEAAFEKAFNCQVQASLAVVASPGEIAPTTTSDSRPQNTANNSNLPAKPGLPSAPTSNQQPENTHPQAPISISSAVETGVKQENQSSEAVTPSQTGAMKSPFPSWQEDEVLRAAKSLAQFFNGEVVNQEKGGTKAPELIPDNGADKPYDLAQPLSNLKEIEMTELEESDDLPF